MRSPGYDDLALRLAEKNDLAGLEQEYCKLPLAVAKCKIVLQQQRSGDIARMEEIQQLGRLRLNYCCVGVL